MENIKLRNELIDAVIDNIINDVKNHDLTAIEELLFFVPVNNLIAYLPEEEGKQFSELIEK